MSTLVKWFTPQFSEITAYQAAIIFLSLLITRPDLRNTLLQVYINSEDTGLFAPPIWIVSIFAVIGLFLSVWHVFSQREKSIYEKRLMSVFVLVQDPALQAI